MTITELNEFEEKVGFHLNQIMKEAANVQRLTDGFPQLVYDGRVLVGRCKEAIYYFAGVLKDECSKQRSKITTS
jgi:CHAD domain-containing protein